MIVHSSKGLKLWNSISERVDCVEVSIDEIAKGNSNLISNKPQSGDRKLFYKTLDENPVKAFGKLCAISRPNILNKILNKLKTIL